MTGADGRGRDARRKGVTLIALNGRPANSSHHPSLGDGPIPELSLVAQPPEAPPARPRSDALPVWPNGSVGEWPDLAVDDLETERSRLLADLAAAHARLAAAQHRATEIRAALHRDVVAAQEHLAAMEREHEATLASIRDTAAIDAAQILAAARQQVAHRSETDHGE